MGADQGARLHRRPRAQPAGRDHGDTLWDGLGAPDAGGLLRQAHIQLHLPREGVRRTVQIGPAVPHVAPVAAAGDAVQAAAGLQQGWEHILSKIPGPVRRDLLQHLGGEQIDAGVDQIGHHLPPGGLLHKADHPLLLVGEDQPVLQGRGMTEEDQGGLGPLGLMELHGGSEIQVADAVSADDQEVLSLQEGGAGPHAAGGAQRGLLDEVVQADPPLLSVPEIGLHCLRHVAQGDGDLVDPVALEQADDVFHHRPAQQRDHGLRHAQGQGAQAGPLSARHNDSFHDVFPPFRPGSAGAERERPCICSIS